MASKLKCPKCGGLDIRRAKLLTIVILLGMLGSFQMVASPMDMAMDDSHSNTVADYEVHDPILITSDADFVSQGWAGSGTPEDPYRIEGLSIDGVDRPCIRVEDTRIHFLIRDCFLYGGRGVFYPAADGAGIYLNNVSYGQLVNNRCTQNEYGISIKDSQNNTLRSNELYVNDYDGICLQYSDNNTLVGNYIHDQYDSIIVTDSHYVRILDNICNPVKGTGIRVNSYGELLYGCDIINNTIIGVGSYIWAYGIELRNCISSVVKNNTIKDNNVGIHVTESLSIIIESNIIENYRGIGLEDCVDISVIWNALNNSYINAQDSNGLNFFDYNFWSDYTGADEDGDGIGDTPYEDIGSNIIDNHPLMYPPGSEPTTTITTTTTTTTTTTPTTTTTTTDETTDSDDQPISPVIVGTVIGAASIIIIAIVMVLGRRRQEPPDTGARGILCQPR